MGKLPHCRFSRFGIPQSLFLYIGERERHPLIYIFMQSGGGRNLDCTKGGIPRSGSLVKRRKLSL
jgi:hypothetical protein